MTDPHYDRGYHGTHHRLLIEDDGYFLARAEAALSYFSPEERERKIFEFGCGIGQSIALLNDAEGWDISSEAREACHRRGLRVYDDLAAVPRQAYDIVFCRHVLEHVEEPLSALRTMRELLRPGGFLLLIVPRETHWPSAFTGDINQHLYCWNFNTINNLLLRAGYQPYHNSYRYPFGWHALLPIRRRFGRKLTSSVMRLGAGRRDRTIGAWRMETAPQ